MLPDFGLKSLRDKQMKKYLNINFLIALFCFALNANTVDFLTEDDHIQICKVKLLTKHSRNLKKYIFDYTKEDIDYKFWGATTLPDEISYEMPKDGRLNISVKYTNYEKSFRFSHKNIGNNDVLLAKIQVFVNLFTYFNHKKEQLILNGDDNHSLNIKSLRNATLVILKGNEVVSSGKLFDGLQKHISFEKTLSFFDTSKNVNFLDFADVPSSPYNLTRRLRLWRFSYENNKNVVILQDLRYHYAKVFHELKSFRDNMALISSNKKDLNANKELPLYIFSSYSERLNKISSYDADVDLRTPLIWDFIFLDKKTQHRGMMIEDSSFSGRSNDENDKITIKFTTSKNRPLFNINKLEVVSYKDTSKVNLNLYYTDKNEYFMSTEFSKKLVLILLSSGHLDRFVSVSSRSLFSEVYKYENSIQKLIVTNIHDGDIYKSDLTDFLSEFRRFSWKRYFRIEPEHVYTYKCSFKSSGINAILTREGNYLFSRSSDLWTKYFHYPESFMVKVDNNKQRNEYVDLSFEFRSKLKHPDPLVLNYHSHRRDLLREKDLLARHKERLKT